MRVLFKDLRKDLEYTLQHKKAFLGVERKLTGKNTLSGYLHDTDKLFLYLLFTKKETSKIHRSYASHHFENVSNEKHMIQMIIDWECNRLTKLDKQENARQYIDKTYPKQKHLFEPYLLSLGL